MALHANLAGEMQGGAFPIEGVLRQSVEGGERDEQRRELGMIDEFEMQLLLAGRRDDGEIERNHGGWRAEFAGDGGKVVAGDGADGAADVDDFGGGERR